MPTHTTTVSQNETGKKTKKISRGVNSFTSNCRIPIAFYYTNSGRRNRI